MTLNLEVRRLEKHETQENKSKSITLKVDSREESEEYVLDEDENFILLVKRLDKFFNNDKSLNFVKKEEIFQKEGSIYINPKFHLL